jgi:hypothetical protein
VSQQDRFRLVEQACPSPRLHGNVESGELLDEAPICGPPAYQHGDIAVANAGVAEVEDQVRDPAGLLGLRRRRPDDDLGSRAAGWVAMRLHRLADAVRDRPRKAVGDVDDHGTAPAVRRDLERCHGRIAVRERHDVRDVGASPLVDGLLVVADNAQLGPRAGQELDQPLLGRVHVLVLVDDQVTQLAVNHGCKSRTLELANGTNDLLTVGEQAIALERVVVGAKNRAKRVGQRLRVKQLVLDDVDSLQEGLDRCEKPVPGIKLLELETSRFPGQERRELVVVEHVVGLVTRDVLLQQAEAVRVDRPDEQPGEAIQGGPTEPPLDPPSDPILQFLGSSLGEGERDDRLCRATFGEQVDDSLGDDLGLARPRSRDDLEMPPAVPHRFERGSGQFWTGHRWT